MRFCFELLEMPFPLTIYSFHSFPSRPPPLAPLMTGASFAPSRMHTCFHCCRPHSFPILPLTPLWTGASFVPAREWMRICFELLEMLKAHKKAIRRATVNTFGYIAKAIGPQVRGERRRAMQGREGREGQAQVGQLRGQEIVCCGLGTRL